MKKKVKRFAEKGMFDPRSFRTVKPRKDVRLLIGCPKGEWNERLKRCRVGTRIYEAIKENPVSPSSEALELFRKIHGTDPGKVTVVNDGFDSEIVILGEITAVEYVIPFATKRNPDKNAVWRHDFIKRPKLGLTKRGEPVIIWQHGHRIDERGLRG